MTRYLFEYIVSGNNSTREFSYVATSEEEARRSIQERVADLEFVDTKDVQIGSLIKTLDASKSYFECEGCT